MTQDEIQHLLVPALRNLNMLSVTGAEMLERDLLRTSYGYTEFPAVTSPISDEYRRELESLRDAGENALIILKMIKIKRGLDIQG